MRLITVFVSFCTQCNEKTESEVIFEYDTDLKKIVEKYIVCAKCGNKKDANKVLIPCKQDAII